MGELRTRKRGKYWEYSFEGARLKVKENQFQRADSGQKLKRSQPALRLRQNMITQAGVLHHRMSV